VSGRIRSTEKFNDLIKNRTRDLPACSIVPQSTTKKKAELARCKVQLYEAKK
jgi:hypothetical protein